ncbi:MAG: NUDIX domain-containing protein [Candidatus Bathyarchaeota archaeon]|nr:NUDIX domain-containing protein [Candidatus Bathyarchaeota archaeon]
MKKEKSAGAIIFRREGGNIYYLLLHYEAGHWDFPKGHIENQEAEIEAVLREVKEETGLEKIKIIPEFTEKIEYSFRKHYSKKPEQREVPDNGPLLVPKEVIFYLAEAKEKNIQLSLEHLDFKWLSYEKAIEEVTYTNAKSLLKKAHQYLLKHERK